MHHFTARPGPNPHAVLLLATVVASGCTAHAATTTAWPSDATPPGSTTATLVLTTPEHAFVTHTVPAAAATSTQDVVTDEDHPGHAIQAFGGAFNEQGWDALSVLDPADRQAVLEALFSHEGLDFDLCRTPIGASDYAMDRYTLNETKDDYAMTSFSIARDRERLIPYIKAALAIRPDLRLWASAWTPPTWMKTGGAFDGGAMRDDPRVYDAYALYLLEYIEAYRDEGIPIVMVVPQNEPGQITHYPSADWTPAQYATFIGDHLGPLLRTRAPDTRIFVGTINRNDWDIVSVLRDPEAARFIAGAGVQWNFLEKLPGLHAAHPELVIMQTETECGNNHWQPGFDPDVPPNDFAYAVHTWRKFRDFIGAGASSYMLWNMVLDEHGKNIDAERPWPQNSAIVVDRRTREVTYTPMYWVTKHFSNLVQRGSRVLPNRGAFDDRVSFLRPDGSVVVELLNAEAEPRTLVVEAKGREHVLELPPHAIATLIVP